MSGLAGPYCWACWHTHAATPHRSSRRRGRGAQPCTRCACAVALTRNPGGDQ